MVSPALEGTPPSRDTRHRLRAPRASVGQQSVTVSQRRMCAECHSVFRLRLGERAILGPFASSKETSHAVGIPSLP